MKYLLKLAIATTVITSTFNAHAGHDRNVYFDQAKVMEVSPVYRFVSTKYTDHRCDKRYLHKSHHRNSRNHSDNVLPTVVGAAIGGTVAKNIFRHSDIKHLGTLTGAVIGGAIAHKVSDTHNNRYHEERHYNRGQKKETHRHCKVKYKKVKTFDYYDVTYRYKGEVFTTKMNTRPARKMRVKIKVEPV